MPYIICGHRRLPGKKCFIYDHIKLYTITYNYINYIQGVRHRKLHFCMQVEDIKLNRKVLYYFTVDSIVNEILIFENCRMRAYPSGPAPNANAQRCTLAPRH